MRRMKVIIILSSIIFLIATIINLFFSLREGESNQVYSIVSDFFLAALFIGTIVFAFIRNQKNDNRMMLAIMCLLPIYFIISGIVGIMRL